MSDPDRPRRWRVARGTYLQSDGTYAVRYRHAGRLRLRTTGRNLAEAHANARRRIAAARDGTTARLMASGNVCR